MDQGYLHHEWVCLRTVTLIVQILHRFCTMLFRWWRSGGVSATWRRFFESYRATMEYFPIGRLPGDFDNRYAWVQIRAPECQEPVQSEIKLKIQMKHLKSIQMKLKIQMEPIESIQMEPIESIPMEPIKSIQMKLIILGNFWAFLLIVIGLLIKCFQVI